MDNQASVRDSRQPGHFWADNEIADEYLPQIGIYGFAVYMLLARYADSKTGQCDPSVSGLASKLGISAPTVRTALDKLKDTGLITIRHRRREKDGKLINQTSIYTILAIKKAQKDLPTKSDLVPNEVDQVLNHVDQGTKPGLGGVLNQVSSNKTHKNKNQLTRGGGEETQIFTPAVQAYFDTYPNETLDQDQMALINSTVSLLPRWKEVLRYWKASKYRAQSIPKMLDRYSTGTTVADDRPGGNRTQDKTGRAPADLPLVTATADHKQVLSADERRRIIESRTIGK